MKIITKNGLIKDIDFKKDKIVKFKTWHHRKEKLTNYGQRSIEWVKSRFGSMDVELVYAEKLEITVIARV